MLISANSDISEKILDILKQLSYKFGKVKGKQVIIDLPFSKTVLAGIINIRRETLSRYLSQLQKEKILLVNKNQYILNYVI
jgi:CRP-like cAMP-binding protein